MKMVPGMECEGDPNEQPHRFGWHGTRRIQFRISAAMLATCSAMEGAEVSPGDSMPIRWIA
jgi:hypothetical protein